MARPKKVIDYETVEKLASIMCTQEEIANFLDLNVSTLKRDPMFSTIYKKGQDKGKMSLRRYQFKIAENNPTMAIWLGKQYLGQRDNEVPTDSHLQVQLVTLNKSNDKRLKTLEKQLDEPEHRNT